MVALDAGGITTFKLRIAVDWWDIFQFFPGYGILNGNHEKFYY